MSAFMNAIFGSPGGFENVNLMSGQQQQMMNQLLQQLGPQLGQGMGYLSDILGNEPGAFDAFEAPIKRQFEQEVVPGIMERFAGAGSGGAISSGGLNQALGQAGRELSQNLSGMRANLKQGALGQLQGLLGQGMQQQFAPLYMQPSMGALQSAIGGLGQGFGMGAFGGFGGFGGR